MMMTNKYVYGIVIILISTLCVCDGVDITNNNVDIQAAMSPPPNPDPPLQQQPPPIMDSGASSFSEISAKLNANAQSTLKKLSNLINLNLDDDDDEKKNAAKQEEATKQAQLQAQQIAAAAAQQQAYLDNMRFQAAMEYQRRRRHRHHRRHRTKHHRGKKTANNDDKNSSENDDNAKAQHKKQQRHHHRRHRHRNRRLRMPRFQQNMLGYPPNMMYMQQPVRPHRHHNHHHHHHHHHRHNHRNNNKQKETTTTTTNRNNNNVAQPRFQQRMPQQQIQSPSLLEYGDPYNTGRLTGVTHAPQQRQNGDTSNAYGMPMVNPGAGGASHRAPTTKMPPSPYAMQYQGHQPKLSPDIMRFRQTLNSAQRQGSRQNPNMASENPNPSGIPLPFYAPNQAPPPAPNQVPAPTAMVQGVYPMQMQQENTGQLPAAGPGMVQNAGLNTATVNFSPLGSHSDLNAYPFSSFIELENEPLRKELPEQHYEIIHPDVYNIATHPLSPYMRTELLDQHMEPFPLLPTN